MNDKQKKSHNVAVNKWKAKNKDKVKQYNSNWMKKYPEKVRARSAKFRKEHPDKAKAAVKRWIERNKEYWYAKIKERAKNNQEEIKQTQIRFRENHPKYRSKGQIIRYHRLMQTLDDKYIRGLMSNKNNVPQAQWPQELIELKRLQIKLERKL